MPRRSFALTILRSPGRRLAHCAPETIFLLRLRTSRQRDRHGGRGPTAGFAMWGPAEARHRSEELDPVFVPRLCELRRESVHAPSSRAFPARPPLVETLLGWFGHA